MRKDINLLFPSLTLNVLAYPLILGIFKTNGLMVLSRYPIKYLKLIFALTNFEITMLLKLTNVYRPISSINLFFCYLF